ncbi:MAG: hypothetical protein COU28_03515 [Candidatus Magasanikbacteria bacterium CG10_big_fil_rev_8_21_14_0_10_36_16]|uniref:Antitoxin n=1 Tax=Candidatus Magasanikbacteria bacterium CG10_big_fil_rev_8_21_14_0_10_36_16 TaxID=1974645 RepID=A0A2H0TZU7_9BACT|nr:MAG: hypothetical protein COU28_03515 [Candidatus Magasanikbacteria bacterium CG10_big_fil_rev_8_21_14_0_10_36_16]
MSANLDRLIKLAKKSGSTLIIHDEQKGDIVMMDLDAYEEMLDTREAFSCEDYNFDNEELYEMSERELLDKINRDIGIWRSYQDEEDKEFREDVLEDDLAKNPPEDPFSEDFAHSPEWHKAGDILVNRHNSFAPNFATEQMPDYFVPDLPNFEDDDEEDDDENNFSVEKQMFGVDDSEDNLVYNTLGQEVFENKNKVPFAKHEEEMKDEEDLDEDPVFFEEPV